MPSEKNETNNVVALPMRVASLEQRLKPATPEQALDRLQVLFAALPTSQAGEDAGLKLEAYVLALSGFSVEAISEATVSILKGTAGFDPRFAPTPPQLAQLCRGHEAARRAELENARRQTEPDTEPDEAERERMAVKLAALSKVLEKTVHEMRPFRKPQAMADDAIEKAIRIMETFGESA